jgi:hypothetical protein
MSAVLLAVLVAGVILINLTVAWVIVRADHGVSALLDGGFHEGNGRDADGPMPTDEQRPGRGSSASEAGAGGSLSEGGAMAADGAGIDDGDPPPLDADGDPPPLDADGDTAVCRHCGAENRVGYRYCRWCVRQGVVPTGFDRGDDTTTARRPL